jgi:IS5 family transposase
MGFDTTMRRGSRGRPLSLRDRLRNRRIAWRRAPDERPFAVFKRMFDASHVLVTTAPRFYAKMVFACLCFDLCQRGTFGGV